MRPLKVAVLVDLAWAPDAGGHVKTWEKFGRAALSMPEALDMTIHFSGGGEGERVLGPNLRYRFHEPVFSTARLPFLAHVPAHTDLAFYHPGLARALEGYDVIHTTDGFFAFARTAVRVGRKRRIPVVNSIHTDTPGYSRIYAAQTLQHLFGKRALGRFLVQGLRLPELAEARARRHLKSHQRAAAFALVSGPEDRERAGRALPPERIGFLGRGMDKEAFHPRFRDRRVLADLHGVPEGRVLVFFAGRLSPGKNVMALARAVRRLADEGMDIHLFCAGEGPDRQAILDLLGDRASCPGFCGAEVLPLMHASADIFVLPALSETWGNAVAEAAAAGVPAIAAARTGASQHIRHGVTGLLLDRADTDELVLTIGGLACDPARRAAMGRAARALAEKEMPSWGEVLARDLLPVWRRAAGWG